MEDCNIVNAFYRALAQRPAETALTALENGSWRAYSFAELGKAAQGYAAALHAQGLRPGDRVMLMVRPSLDFIALTFALFHLGTPVILIDPGMGYKNLLRCIAAVRPGILIGIPPAILFSLLFRRPFAAVRKRLRIGGAHWLPGIRLTPAQTDGLPCPPARQAETDELAAIIFTTGSTGPPKGVRYTHGIFHTQLGLIREYYGIGPGDVDQPGFPLFGLFSAALGAAMVIPDMDPTRPARVNPQKFVRSLQQFGVTYSFGSPAIWNVVSAYCLREGIVLPVKKVLMAGAPVSWPPRASSRPPEARRPITATAAMGPMEARPTRPKPLSSPAFFSTGKLSPVMALSSTTADPSVSIPSTGIPSPDLTERMSPGSTSSTETVVSTPFDTRTAVLGARSISFLIESEVLPLERASKYFPAVMSVSMVAPDSK